MNLKTCTSDLIKNNDDIPVLTEIKRENEDLEYIDETSTMGDSQMRKKLEINPMNEQSIDWRVCFELGTLHVLAIYALMFEAYNMKLYTHLFRIALFFWAAFGYGAGAHRLWTHRTYKATLPLRVILLFGFGMTAHMSVYSWVKIHRMHHKYTDTDLDPHNAKRGLFYSHLGWLMLKRSPEYKLKALEIDMSDVLDDRLISFHSRYFATMTIMNVFILPTLIPVYFWDEHWYLSLLSMVMALCTFIHFASSANSLAHKYGAKPYNKEILPTENLLVSLVTFGEGWHNYHHVFPWDYKAGEFGNRFNFSAQLLDLFAKIGWAYDLKTPSPELVKSVWQKHGDGNHISIKNHDNKIL